MLPCRSGGKLKIAVAVLCGLFAVLAAFPASAMTRQETGMTGFVNEDRANHSLKPLDASSTISEIAHRHSLEMARKGRLFHSCVECILDQHGWQRIGENIGYGATLSSVNREFMHSTYHRENILCTCHTDVAVGVVESGGLIWVTEIFYRP